MPAVKICIVSQYGNMAGPFAEVGMRENLAQDYTSLLRTGSFYYNVRFQVRLPIKNVYRGGPRQNSTVSKTCGLHL